MLPHGGDLNLDEHSRVEQVGRDHRCGWTDLSKVRPEYRPAFLKIATVWQYVVDSDDVGERCSCLGQCGLDIFKALSGLFLDQGRDRHRRVVEASGARHKNPIALNYSARVGDLLFEWRPGADEFAIHKFSCNA